MDCADPRTIYVGSRELFNEKLNPHAAANPHGVLPSSHIYWRTNTGKVWKPTDAGTSGRLMNTGIDPRAVIGPIHVDRHDPRTIYLATSYGFYRSEDGGASWTASSSGLATGIIRGLTMHYDAGTRQTTPYAVDQVVWEPDGAGSISSRGGVFRSTDGAAPGRTSAPVCDWTSRHCRG